MKKAPRCISILLPAILWILSTSCAKKPIPNFNADRTTVNAGESVKFSDLSSNEPSRWNWTFEGGNPSSSRDQNPVVTYNTPGSYSVSLEASHGGDGEILTRDNYITVTDPNTDVRFINRTHTTIDISLGAILKHIPPGDSVTYLDVEGETMNVVAQTSGEDGGGDPIGITLYWDFDVELTGGVNRNNMNISTDYFFLYLTNEGTHELTPIVVYDGEADPWIEDGFYIPADGVTYHLGYYHAYESTQIRAYYDDEPDYYTYWDHNVHFFFPDELNQSISLSNSFKKSATVAGSGMDPGHNSNVRAHKPLPLPSGPVRNTTRSEKSAVSRLPVRSR